jgi:hypothetical protein
MNLTIFQIVVAVGFTGDWCSQHHRNRPKNHFGSLTNELKIKTAWSAIANELDIKRCCLPATDAGQCARVIDNANSRIGRSQRNIHGDVGDRILNCVCDTIGHSGSEAAGDLEVERISRRDRVGRAVGDCCSRLIDGPRQLCKSLKSLARVSRRKWVCSESNDKCSQSIQACDSLLKTCSGTERRCCPGNLSQRRTGRVSPPVPVTVVSPCGW